MSFDLQMLTDSSSLIDDEVKRGFNGFSAEGDAEDEDIDEEDAEGDAEDEDIDEEDAEGDEEDGDEE